MQHLIQWGVRVLLGLVMIGLTYAYALNDPDQHNRLLQIEQEKQELQERLEQTVEKEKNVLFKVSQLRTELRKKQGDFQFVSQRLNKQQGRVGQLQRSLAQSSQSLKTHRQAFSQRMREIYMSQNLGYLTFLFSANGWDQLVQHQYTFQRMIELDTGLLERMNKEYQALKRRRDYLRQEELELNKLKQNLVGTMQDISYKETLQSAFKEKLRQEREAYERRLEELERTSHEIEQMLQRIAPGNRLGTGEMIMPARGWLSSYFGNRRHPIFKVVKFHTGIDVAAPRGRKIVAADSGKVVHAGWWGGYGQATIIDHGDGLTTVYAHQSRIVVTPGQIVSRGETIGYVGSTGNSTGPHLHFEVRKNGKPVDPMGYVN